jgi:hypothetical protein
MVKQKWSEEEERTLSKIFETSSWPVLQETLGRTESSIRSKASRLGLARAEWDLSDIMRIREERAQQGLLIET